MKTVFAVEEGDYSSYHVVGIYATREAAELVKAAVGADNVAEWPLDPALEEIREGRTQFDVTMRRDGAVERIKARDNPCSHSLDQKPSIWRRSQIPLFSRNGVPDAMVVSVFASDEQHAIKIANEKRGQMIAMGQWDEAP